MWGLVHTNPYIFEAEILNEQDATELHFGVVIVELINLTQVKYEVTGGE